MDLRARVDDAELVRAARAGDGQAFGVLFDRWSARVVDVAYRIVRDREVAAEVAQDAFLAAWTGLARLERPESFGGWVLRIGRNRALNRLERERRSVPVGDEETTAVLDRPTEPSADAGDAAARAEDAELVWAAAAALGPRDASVLDLHLRHGLTPGEIAEELGVTANTAHQVLFRLRSRLGDAVRACVLWRAGHPACADLAGAAAAAGVTAFGADAVKVVAAHAEGCAECAGRQEARLSPEALFAALPLLVVAPEVLAAIRRGLADAGVPVGEAPSNSVPTDDAPSGDAAGADPSAGAPPDPPGPGSLRRPALVAVAAGLLVLVVVAILLLPDDEAEPEQVAADATTSSTTTTEEGSPSSPTTERPATTTTTTGPGVSSLPAPAPTAPATTTTGPSADIGTTTEPGFTPNPTTTRPPSAPTTTTTTTTTEPPPAPPTIISFTATRIAGTGCVTPSQRIALSWRTSGADDVRITGPGAPTGSRPASGTGVGCSAGPGAYTLTASGPGGATPRTVTVP